MAAASDREPAGDPAAAPTESPMNIDEVLAEMDDRTRVGWDAAYARVENRHLRREIARLTNAQNAAAAPK
jgi:hypothetical protein